MVFSSLIFLFRFLPLALLAYFLAPRFLKNGVLLVISLFFYAWGEPRYVLIMFISIAVDYIASGGIERNRSNPIRKRLFLALSICTNLGLLLGFKYSNFLIENLNAAFGLAMAPIAITLPLGISFYTFQTLSYSIDVYRGEVPAERNLIDFGAYVCLFPQLIAGPIVRYVDIRKALKSRTVDFEQIESGIGLFILGLASKVLIANNAGMLWDDIQKIGFGNLSLPMAWLGIAAFTLQIYFDFGGYSLMAIGLGRILGFEFPRNFDDPYAAKSVTEFWRRWHMTLGSWFRSYVYIPMGGNQKGFPRQVFNLLIVWFLTGFWHGASWNFVFWGLYFFVFLVLEKLFLLKWLNRHTIAAHVYLIGVVMVSWVIFAITDIGGIGLYLQKMFSGPLTGEGLYYFKSYGLTLILGALFSTPLTKKWYAQLKARRGVFALTLSVIFFVCVSYLVGSSFNPFLYFRF
ncbi:MAG: hypothetical protein PWQ12_236 [Clostridiales bacterium]|jgi:alginate O-acetyltransferase complex protein AlgI|nr:hypothetical protein [Clostridiales bacterium]